MAKLLNYGVHDATVYPYLFGCARYILMATMSDEA
jgi:hypothetical protein